MRHFVSICTAAGVLAAVTGAQAQTPYPDVVNTSHATPQAADYFKSYFTAKSRA